jgi:hypothetical protein
LKEFEFKECGKDFYNEAYPEKSSHDDHELNELDESVEGSA